MPAHMPKSADPCPSLKPCSWRPHPTVIPVSPSRRICPTSPLLAPAWQRVLLLLLPPCRRCRRAAAGRAHHACELWQAASHLRMLVAAAEAAATGANDSIASLVVRVAWPRLVGGVRAAQCIYTLHECHQRSMGALWALLGTCSMGPGD